MRENLRRAAECALLGLLWTVCSLPLVTAGAAWSGVAEICRAWNRGEEPPLARTFATVLRRDFAGGLAMSVLGVAGAALLLEARIALAARLPGAQVEAVALGLAGVAALCVVALAFSRHAAGTDADAAARTTWRESVRGAAVLCVCRPWVIPVTAVALGIPALLVVVLPPVIVFIAGPAGYAVSAVHDRAAARAAASRDVTGLKGRWHADAHR